MSDLRQRLAIPEEHFRQINRFLTDPDSEVINDFLRVVEKHGGPEEINRQANAARQLPRLLERLEASGSPYLADVQWLIDQRDAGAFVSIDVFRRRIVGDAASTMTFDEAHAVTLEISALQFFPVVDRGGETGDRAGRDHAGTIHPCSQHEGASGGPGRHTCGGGRHADHRRQLRRDAGH